MKYYQALNKEFDAVIYSADPENFSQEIGIKHIVVQNMVNQYGIRHLQFYMLLLKNARNMDGLIFVEGTSIPFLPIIKIISKSKLVVVFHNDWGQGVKKDHPWTVGALIGKSIQKQSLNAADMILATHSWLQKRAQEICNRRCKVNISPNFISEEVFFPAKNKGKIIIFVGRIHWSKGLEYLLRGFSKIRREFPDFVLKIVGGGDERYKFEKLVMMESIQGVQFLGPIKNNSLGDILREALIFVLPSINMEGHPVALIEAMACGVAPIVTDVPGNRDLITNYKSGIVIPPKSSEELYQAIKFLILNENNRLQIEQNVVAESKQYFFHEVIKREIEFLNSL